MNAVFFRTTVAGIAAVGALALAACGPSDPQDVRSQVQRNTESPKQMPGDKVISAKVQSALLVDERLQGAGIKVDTSNGLVTLSGTVSDPVQRERAVQIARGVEGVKDVQDAISVN